MWCEMTRNNWDRVHSEERMRRRERDITPWNLPESIGSLAGMSSWGDGTDENQAVEIRRFRQPSKDCIGCENSRLCRLEVNDAADAVDQAHPDVKKLPNDSFHDSFVPLELLEDPNVRLAVEEWRIALGRMHELRQACEESEMGGGAELYSSKGKLFECGATGEITHQEET